MRNFHFFEITKSLTKRICEVTNGVGEMISKRYMTARCSNLLWCNEQQFHWIIHKLTATEKQNQKFIYFKVKLSRYLSKILKPFGCINEGFKNMLCLKLAVIHKDGKSDSGMREERHFCFCSYTGCQFQFTNPLFTQTCSSSPIYVMYYLMYPEKYEKTEGQLTVPLAYITAVACFDKTFSRINCALQCL